MPHRTVAAYMQEKVRTVSPDTTLRGALEKMIKERTNGLVVANAEGKVVGILSGWDVIQYLVPDYLETDRHLASFESADLFADRLKEIANDPVDRFMTKEVHTCQADHSLMEAATLLSEYRIRQLPVVNEKDQLIGYINRTDIKRAMGDVLGLSEA